MTQGTEEDGAAWVHVFQGTASALCTVQPKCQELSLRLLLLGIEPVGGCQGQAGVLGQELEPRCVGWSRTGGPKTGAESRGRRGTWLQGLGVEGDCGAVGCTV